MKRTASAFVINEKEELLCIFHKKFGKWVQPGGHIEENETPMDAAIREVFEETGITIQMVEKDPIYIKEYHNNVGDQLDYQFLAIPVTEVIEANHESKKASFLSLAEMKCENTVDDLVDTYILMLQKRREIHNGRQNYNKGKVRRR